MQAELKKSWKKYKVNQGLLLLDLEFPQKAEFCSITDDYHSTTVIHNELRK